MGIITAINVAPDMIGVIINIFILYTEKLSEAGEEE